MIFTLTLIILTLTSIIQWTNLRYFLYYFLKFTNLSSYSVLHSLLCPLKCNSRGPSAALFTLTGRSLIPNFDPRSNWGCNGFSCCCSHFHPPSLIHHPPATSSPHSFPPFLPSSFSSGISDPGKTCVAGLDRDVNSKSSWVAFRAILSSCPSIWVAVRATLDSCSSTWVAVRAALTAVQAPELLLEQLWTAVQAPELLSEQLWTAVQAPGLLLEQLWTAVQAPELLSEQLWIAV